MTPFTSAVPQLITPEVAQQQFNLNRYDIMGRVNFKNVIFLDGDTYINGDLNQEWAESTLNTLGEAADASATLILVNGNLTVSGILEPSDEIFPYLLVLGNVTCNVLRSYNEFIYITGDADIKFVFDGGYNDGSITIEGTTRVPYIINYDHDSNLNPKGAILINYYGDVDDFFEYDYTVKDFERVMVPAVFDEDDEFNKNNFIALVQAGESPLKKGALTAREIQEKEIAEMGNIEELDLTKKK